MADHAVIFDLDGTLADVRHRLHHVQKRPPDWPAFFDACVDDPPHDYVVTLNGLVALANDPRMCEGRGRDRIEIFICSGRPDSHQRVTANWLTFHGVEYDHLLMRVSGDHRPDVEVKREMLRGIRGQGYEVLFSMDDRPSVVNMWREEGVPCLAVDDSPWHEPQARYTEDQEGSTLLTLMVGPSHAGKSSWLAGESLQAPRPRNFGIHPSHVLASDQIRRDLHGGEYVYDKEENARVFTSMHVVARARLAMGLPVVLDATHLRRKERLQAVDLAPRGTRVRYLVFDRPLDSKVASRREEIPEEVIRKMDQMFRSQEADVMRGDDRPDVDVVDMRRR